MTTRKKTKDQKKADKRRVFLVVVDDSKELHQALYFACKRAISVNGRVALLRCIGQAEFQHWIGVGELMVEEAREEAEQLLRTNSEWVHELTGEYPIVHLREGDPKSEVIDLIDNEPEISILVLGANVYDENTGPLINFLTTRGASQCRVPITIVPGHLSDEDIDNVS
ncbi:MAG: universal stress protein [Candidatus Puniceispirillales bacterium]|nr:universal stress protein [Pseudomonadota bacterium]